jgi:vacuolar protein-sorting-associated protein 4
VVKLATDEDHSGNYEKAYTLYQNALAYFMTALKCKHQRNFPYGPALNLSLSLSFSKDERNDRLREPIRRKCAEYLDRAEILKDYLNATKVKTTQEHVGVPKT